MSCLLLTALYSFDNMGPAIQALPEFLKENHYQDSSDPARTPVQKGWNTDQSAFVWIESRGVFFHHFNQWMSVQRLGMPTWLDRYPYKEKAEDLEPDRPFFVDIAGGFGHQSVALRKKLPNLENRIIVQDMASVVEKGIKHPDVEVMVYDFRQPQPVKGKPLVITSLFEK